LDTRNGQTIAAANCKPISARKLELQVAATAGEDLLDSVRTKREEKSSNDDGEVLAELKAYIAAHNMFHPRTKTIPKKLDTLNLIL
jgi:hypothetical protein